MSLDIRALPSPNFNDRKTPVSLILLHYTGMETGAAAIERLCDPEASVSAHYVVEEDGSVLQLVGEDKRAWHAGVSYWRGERDINSASIGIEIVNGGHEFGLPNFPDAQIGAVMELVGAVMGRHGISPAGVIGHSDVAPGRKEDPGEKFPWQRLADAGLALALPDAPGRAGAPETLLAGIGYDPDAGLKAVLEAFQRRWRPARVDGHLDDETRDLVARVASAA